METDLGYIYDVSYNYVVNDNLIYIDLGDSEVYLSEFDLLKMLEVLRDQE